MANQGTLYRFKISLSDVDRALYESLDFRASMHASESEEFLLTRVLAFILNFEDGLEFSAGLSTPDEPAISRRGGNGEILSWIEIGNPSARRLHKASKACKVVRVYTYKDPELLKKECATESVHRAGEIEVYSIDPKFLRSLATSLKRDNPWTVIYNDSELMITVGDENFMATVGRHRLES